MLSSPAHRHPEYVLGLGGPLAGGLLQVFGPGAGRALPRGGLPPHQPREQQRVLERRAEPGLVQQQEALQLLLDGLLLLPQGALDGRHVQRRKSLLDRGQGEVVRVRCRA